VTLVHRHLDIAGDTPVDQLPLDALDNLLDRGDFDDWRALTTAIHRDPNGPLADRVLALCRAHDMYGTSRLWPDFIARVRAAARHQPATTASSASLTSLRKRRGITQAAAADALGISQSDVSKIERRTDIRVSTLARYVRALGGELHIEARFPDDDPIPLSI
jgi:DNA-binding XRE family transcriptional regulator